MAKKFSDLSAMLGANLNGSELVCIADVDTTAVTASTISAATADNSFNDSADGLGSYKVGQKIAVSGFAAGGLNGEYTVASVAAGKITTEETLSADEAAGASVTIAVVNKNYKVTLDELATAIGSSSGGGAETVYAATNDLNAANGGIQTYTMAANTTFTITMAEGQHIALHLSGGSTYTATWPTITWVGGVAPTLTANDVIEFWKVGSTIYGAYVGSVA